MEPQSAAWLRQLADAPGLLPDGALLHPGHGDPGQLTMLDQQAAYLERFRAEVRTLAEGGPTLDDSSKDSLHDRMTEHLPGAPLEMLIKLNADPVAVELLKER